MRTPVDDLKAYRVGPFTILQLMALLAVLGVTVACLWRYFFTL